MPAVDLLARDVLVRGGEGRREALRNAAHAKQVGLPDEFEYAAVVFEQHGRMGFRPGALFPWVVGNGRV
jgi:hypothetical protein